MKSASGFPISGALVYLTSGLGTDIPYEAYCNEGDEVPYGQWTVSNADGTWAIQTALTGTFNIVTRKGDFQRVRELQVIGGPEFQDVPESLTTLPGANSDDQLDRIPDYAVLMNTMDYPEDLLARMGLGELDSSGDLVHGTEQFDLYNHAGSSPSAVGDATQLFEAQENLDTYHMIFFPCICSGFNLANNAAMLRQYLEVGGKMYASCWAGHWAEQTLPDVIDFNGADVGSNPGNVGVYDTAGSILDDEMRAWLSVVQPNENLDHYPLTDAWINIESISDTAYDGYGVVVNDDGTVDYFTGPVIPSIWVNDVERFPGSPMNTTFPYGCGKVFYSTFHVTTSSSSDIDPQEWILIYLFYEVGAYLGTPRVIF